MPPTTRRHRRPVLIGLGLIPLIIGCHAGHVQSALHPAGPGAEAIARLWWFLFVVCTGVFLFTMAALGVALLRRRQDDDAPFGNRFVIVLGILFPTVIVLGFLIVGLETAARLRAPNHGPVIEVIGHQFWWEVRYPDTDIVTANEIHIPVGQPVRMKLRSADVIHSFWAPNLAGKMDMLPDHWTSFWIQADVAGEYRGQCAEYCGVQHARMSFYVIALPPDQYADWIKQQRQPTPEPTNETQARGKKVFFETAACGNCHSVRGEAPPVEQLGPDLTHLASRRGIAAGCLPNNRGNLAGWIGNPQAIKPGNKMPRTFVPPDDLHALLEYLSILK